MSGFDDDLTLDEIAARQGIIGPHSLEQMLGHGAHLWKSDEEFEEFVRGIAERRAADRERARR